VTLFNQEELAMIAIALDEEEADDQEDYQQAIKRIWVCDLWEDSETAGEYYTLCQKLTRHPNIIMITSKCQNILSTLTKIG
jgi:hypothetical protein